MRKFAVAILLAAAVLAHARIGETLEQCIVRYGPVVRMDVDGIYYFARSGLNIGLRFFEKRVDFIMYAKQEKDSLGTPLPLSDNEVQLLLSSNGGEAKWKEVSSFSLDTEWKTEDGLLLASKSWSKNVLLVVTAAANKRATDEKAAKEKEKLSGF